VNVKPLLEIHSGDGPTLDNTSGYLISDYLMLRTANSMGRTL